MQHLMLNIAFSRGTACGVKSRALYTAWRKQVTPVFLSPAVRPAG